MVVIHSTCSDSLSNVSFIFLNLITATLLSSDFSGLCVILLYRQFPLSLFSIGLITARLNCREKNLQIYF